MTKTNILSPVCILPCGKSRLSSLVLILLFLASCSTDENKISFSDGNIFTGPATDVTATSAVLSGSYNFYGAVGSVFNLGATFIPFTVKLDTADIDSLARYYKNPQEVKFPEGCPDSIELSITVVDLDMRAAGIVYSEYRDFYECKKYEHRGFKSDAFEKKITGLKPGTTYWYKTYCQSIPTFYLESIQYDIAFFTLLPDESVGEFFDYYGYGDTKSFTTLSK